MKRTPFFDIHRKYNAKFVEFAGYEMPLYYTSILDESLWTREKASLFDVSHMARFLVEGEESYDFIEYSFTNSLRKLKGDIRAQYTLILNEKGGIIDDAYIYKLEENKFLIVVNAANRTKDWNVLKERSEKFKVSLKDVSEDMSQLAFQGPYSLNIITEIFKKDLTSVKRNRVFMFDDVIITSTGYTGEKGVEIYGNPDDLMEIAEKLLKYPEVRWAGLGARDILRLEAGYPLYGNDIDEETDPFSANLDWVVSMDKEFVGKEALKNKEIKVKRRGFIHKGRGAVPKKGDKILLNGEEIGYITSATYSPNASAVIAMGYIPLDIKGRVLVKSRREMYMDITDYPFVELPKW